LQVELLLSKCESDVLSCEFIIFFLSDDELHDLAVKLWIELYV